MPVTELNRCERLGTPDSSKYSAAIVCQCHNETNSYPSHLFIPSHDLRSKCHNGGTPNPSHLFETAHHSPASVHTERSTQYLDDLDDFRHRRKNIGPLVWNMLKEPQNLGSWTLPEVASFIDARAQAVQ